MSHFFYRSHKPCHKTEGAPLNTCETILDDVGELACRSCNNASEGTFVFLAVSLLFTLVALGFTSHRVLEGGNTLYATASAGTFAFLSFVCSLIGKVLGFEQNFALEDAIGSHACSLEAHACSLEAHACSLEAHACSLEASMRVINRMPLECPLPLTVRTFYDVTTLKACFDSMTSQHLRHALVL
jgi:hypothetical protein